MDENRDSKLDVVLERDDGGEINIKLDSIDGSCDDDMGLILGQGNDYDDQVKDKNFKYKNNDKKDSEHGFDEEDMEKFIARGTQFQKGDPIFHGLTSEQINTK